MYNTEISGILLFLSQQLKPYVKRASDEGWHNHLGGGDNGKAINNLSQFKHNQFS